MPVSLPSSTLETDSPDLFDQMRERLTPRQREIYYLKFIGEKLNSTIAAILRVSLSTIEKDLKVIRAVRDELCSTSIEKKLDLATDIAIAHGRTLTVGKNKTLRAIITGVDRRRISLRGS